MTKVFISHATKDRPYVEEWILPAFHEQGIETWYCKEEIKAADQWEKAIRDGLSHSDWVVVLISQHSVGSQWVHAEVHWGFERRAGKVLPLLLDGSDPIDLHLKLGAIQYFDVRSPSPVIFRNVALRILSGIDEDEPVGKAKASSGATSLVTLRDTFEWASFDESLVHKAGMRLDQLLEVNSGEKIFLGFYQPMSCGVLLQFIKQDGWSEAARLELMSRLKPQMRWRHKGLGRLLDVISLSGCCVLVKEMPASNCSFADWQYRERRERVSPSAAVAALLLALDALSYAHRNGFVHANLTLRHLFIDEASNVLVEGFEQVIIQEVAQNHGLALSCGIAMGTPTHMAPERLCLGVPLSPGMDVYSMGSIGLQLLTGRYLSDLWSSTEECPGLSECAKPLERVIFQSIQSDTERRYRSATEFANALRKSVQKRPLLARLFGRPGRKL